jgi:DNA repair exonuclease SbcCD nuclease subunit
MSILLVGDLHIKLDNVEATEQMLNEIIEIIINKNPIAVVILGDILHTHDKIITGPLVRAVEFLRKIRDRANYLVVLIGNHDRPNNADFLTENHPFTALKSWENTMIVDYPSIIQFEAYKFLAIPYVQPGRLIDALHEIGLDYEHLSDYSAVFLHQEMHGCKMGAVVSESTDVWPITAPMAFSGHIHDYHKLQPNFIYVGTPIQHSFGDSTDKAVMIVKFAGGKYKSLERIKLRVPSKMQVRLTVDEIMTFEPPEGVILKITITGDPVQIRHVLSLEHIKEILSRPGIKYTICDTRPGVKLTDEYFQRNQPIVFHEAFGRMIEREPPTVRRVCQKIGLL